MRRSFSLLALALILTGCGGPRYQRTEQMTVEEATPLPKEVVIMIDPGHGGKDQGAHSKQPKYEEKEFTLQTSFFLKRYLQDMGYRAFVTRGDDTFIPLKVRSSFANANDVNLFISMHYNAAKSKEAHGVEVFYYNSEADPARSKRSKKLAEFTLSKVVEQTSARSRGVKHGNLAVLRQTKMPAILVEGGFLTNDKERARIQDKSYQQQIAWSIAQGVKQYLTPKPTPR